VIPTPASIAGNLTGALALNVTAVGATKSTYITVWPNGIAKPPVSNLNPAAGQTVPNATITELDSANKFDVYNNAGTTNIVIDVAGTYEFYPFTINGAAKPFGVKQQSGLTPHRLSNKAGGVTMSLRRQLG
jgi:hypothetical protein